MDYVDLSIKKPYKTVRISNFKLPKKLEKFSKEFVRKRLHRMRRMRPGDREPGLREGGKHLTLQEI